MTQSLWMLLGFAAWTLTVLMVGVGVRRWGLILTGRANLTSFPADTPHGSPGYRRAMRAHANCVENLPVFGAIVLTASAAHLEAAGFDQLAAVVLAEHHDLIARELVGPAGHGERLGDGDVILLRERAGVVDAARHGERPAGLGCRLVRDRDGHAVAADVDRDRLLRRDRPAGAE